MDSAISRIHSPSRPIAGSSSTSTGHQVGARRGQLSAIAPPNECPTTSTGPSASFSTRVASAATLASMVHGADHDDRPCPSRSGAATAISGRCSVRQRPPAPAVAGQPVDGEDPSRPGRAVAVHVKMVGHGFMLPDAGGRTCRTPVVSCPHDHTPHRSAAVTEPPTCCAPGCVAPSGSSVGRAPGKTSLLVGGRRGAYRRRDGPGIGSAADGFGPVGGGHAQHAHRGAAHRALGTSRAARSSVNRWSARCTATRSRCCGWPPPARG